MGFNPSIKDKSNPKPCKGLSPTLIRFLQKHNLCTTMGSNPSNNHETHRCGSITPLGYYRFLIKKSQKNLKGSSTITMGFPTHIPLAHTHYSALAELTYIRLKKYKPIKNQTIFTADDGYAP